MSNKAFAIAAKLFNSSMLEEHLYDELGRRGTARCVIENIRHDQQRRATRSRTSDIELIGHAWRADHGFGRPFHSGTSYRAKMARDRAEAAKRRLQRKQSLRAKVWRTFRDLVHRPKVQRLEGRKQ